MNRTRSLRMVATGEGTVVSVGRTIIVRESRRSRAGTAEPVMPLDPETIQRAIAAGMCPWCPRGPFTVLAGHVVKLHGIGRRELCDMAGLMYSDSICDPDFSAAAAKRSRDRDSVAATRRGLRSPRRVLSAAAHAGNLKKLYAIPPEVREQARRRATIRRTETAVRHLVDFTCVTCSDTFQDWPSKRRAVCDKPECDSERRRRIALANGLGSVIRGNQIRASRNAATNRTSASVAPKSAPMDAAGA